MVDYGVYDDETLEPAAGSSLSDHFAWDSGSGFSDSGSVFSDGEDSGSGSCEEEPWGIAAHCSRQGGSPIDSPRPVYGPVYRPVYRPVYDIRIRILS